MAMDTKILTANISKVHGVRDRFYRDPDSIDVEDIKTLLQMIHTLDFLGFKLYEDIGDLETLEELVCQYIVDGHKPECRLTNLL